MGLQIGRELGGARIDHYNGPHAVTQNDIHKGYFIPKGMSHTRMLSTCSTECFTRGNHRRKRLVRSSRTSRDRARYLDGDTFMPERFRRHVDGRQSWRVCLWSWEAKMSRWATTPRPGTFGSHKAPSSFSGRHAAGASVWSAIVTMSGHAGFQSRQGCIWK